MEEEEQVGNPESISSIFDKTEGWGDHKGDPLEKILNLRAWAQEFSYTPEEWKRRGQ